MLFACSGACTLATVFMCRHGCGAGRGRATRVGLVHRLGIDGGGEGGGESLGSPSDARAAGSNGLGMGVGGAKTHPILCNA